MSSISLHSLFDDAARRFPDRIAIEESNGETITYAQLAGLSNRVRDRLRARGIQRGDRVGVWLTKSADAVASFLGIMKAGAAYVPVDPTAPAERNTLIFRDCGVALILTQDRYAAAVREGFEPAGSEPPMILLSGTGAGRPLELCLEHLDGDEEAGAYPSAAVSDDSLAYVLYTSGSTGRPKGVVLSHGNARSFVAWCAATFDPCPSDRFSSHAPFHFDLSILDIYLPLSHGATLVIVDEKLGKEPGALAAWIAEKRLTSWYSAPSILAMMAQFGGLEAHDYGALRTVLFAGEVFPIKHLKALRDLWPGPRFFNLYGPTETNVCTYHEIPARIPSEQVEPMPIGRPCAHCAPLVVDEAGEPVAPGTAGELCIAGPSVLQGYWNLPTQTTAVFLEREGRRWYRTGDLVTELPEGGYRFIGRRDRMIKKRGYRIELGEIEAALYRHPAVKEAAVIAHAREDGLLLHAFLSTHDERVLSMVEMKTFCAARLPLYMVPDRFTSLPSLPQTSTGKVDFQQLQQRLQTPAPEAA
ncbi:MAG: amino acid adenylation domain-containing protein [Verrucomicrobiales bacterium]|nr:amino acid adenylation domain-containing protein [Verrucomicrobiales bacterium]